MSLKINSQAANSTAKTTQREINFRQWIPEADAECDLYGENGERMPYYPARPRHQDPYELVWNQNAWRLVLEMLAQIRGGHPTSPHLWSDDSQLFGMRPSSSSPPTERRPSPSS
jgi:hypothetical protein